MSQEEVVELALIEIVYSRRDRDVTLKSSFLTEQTKLYREPALPHLRFIRFPLKVQRYIGNDRIIGLLSR
jgi:hypothetical protein